MAVRARSSNAGSDSDKWGAIALNAWALEEASLMLSATVRMRSSNAGSDLGKRGAIAIKAKALEPKMSS